MGVQREYDLQQIGQYHDFVNEKTYEIKWKRRTDEILFTMHANIDN